MLLQANANKKLQPDAIKAIISKADGLLAQTEADYPRALEHFQKNQNMIGFTPTILAPRVQVNSAADYANLKSGTPYIDPQGNTRVKP